MAERNECVGATLAFEPGYLRPTPIRDSALAAGKDIREYVGFVVDKGIDALCREAAKEMREELIDFVMDSVRRTNPKVDVGLEALREQNRRDAISLAMPKQILKENLRARFQYFDTRWGDIQYIHKDHPELDPPGLPKR